MTTHAIPPQSAELDAVPAQLTFEIDSAGAANTIYVTADASQNSLVLKMGTTANATFTNAPTIVDEPQAAKATGSLLYLDLTPLSLSTAEFAALAPASAGWKFQTFPDDQLIGMTPEATTTLAAGDTIELTLGALACAQATGASASLTVTVFRVGGITIGALPFPTNFTVALATPPDGGDDLTKDLMIDLATPTVVNTVDGYDPVANQLAFAFYPGPRGRPVKATAASQFTLTFVYATDPSGYGALCTPAEVQPPFEVVKGVGATKWKITPNRAQESPSWTIQPPTGTSIVSKTAPVSILANDLITKFQPGPTLALISYSGFEGYADGVFALPIEKIGHVRIDGDLTITPNPSILDEQGVANVKVSWKVANAGTMTLQPFDVDVTGKTSYTGPITTSTLITLTADGTALANAGNIAIRSTMASVLPVINSFDASPRALYAGDLPRDSELSWNVNTNDDLELISSVDGPDPTHYAAAGRVTKSITAPQMFTLVPLKQQGTDIERSVIVSAFSASSQMTPLIADSLAAPPNASYVVAADSRGTVTAVDTMVFAPVSSGGVPCGAGPAGMVFTPDGKTLYIANSADGTVSVVGVTSTGSVPQYSFQAQSTIQIGGSPERLALSPDGKYLYVSVDGGTQTGQLAVVSTATGTVTARLNVGMAPRGVAVLPSGAQIFVANSGSSTVTVIGRSTNGHHNVVDQISNVASAQDVAVTADGALLLVACPSAGAVIAINAEFPQAPRASLAVGASPQSLALLPGGGYAAVTCGGAGTVALISTGATPADCAVVDAELATISGASAIAVTPDGGLLLAGAGRAGTAAVQLIEYQAATMAPKVGGQPTNALFSSDGTYGLAWHDALVTIRPGTPANGLQVFEVASGTATPQMSDVPIVDVALAPAAKGTAFIAVKGQSALNVVSTSNWATTGTIDLSGQTTGKPVALGISADGCELFALTAGSAGVDLVVFGDKSGTYSPLGVVHVFDAPEQGSMQTLAVAPDGSAAYVTDAANGSLYVIAKDKTGTYALQGSPIDTADLPQASAISADGSALFIASAGITNGAIARFDTAAAELTTVQLPSNAQTELQSLDVSPDGSRVFATDSIAVGIRVFDATSLRLVQTLSLAQGTEFPNGIAVAPDGSRIITANSISGTIGVATQVQADAAKAARVQKPTMLAPVHDRTIPKLIRGELDDTATYSGFFIRDYVGQTPTSGTQGSTDCPDIWPSGQGPLPTPADLVTNYQTTDSPNVIYTSGTGVNNWVYVRGLNATSGAMQSRIWLYYLNGGGSPQMILWPPNWLNNGIQTQNTANTWSPVTSSTANEVVYTQDPFLWSAVPVDGHYCMVAWADNQPLSTQPVDPRQGIGSIGTMDQLAAFIAANPNFGWKNTQEQPTPTGESFEMVLPLIGPPQAGLFKAGLQFSGMPSDGNSYFSFSINGPNVQPARKYPPSVNVPKTPITQSDQTYLVPLDWTGFPNYETNVVVTIWTPNGTLPQGATVQIAAANFGSSALVGLTPDPLAAARLMSVYPTGLPEGGVQQEWLTIVGEVMVVPPSS